MIGAAGPPDDESRGRAAPRVSVIAIFLNGEQFLAEAVDSVIAQTYADWELLLVDDGSGPAATEIAKGFVARHPGKIRYLEHPGHVNRGAAATRNLGIRHARGEYLALIDADDVWLPSKLSDQVAILDALPEVGMVCGSAIYWGSWSGGKDILQPTGHVQDAVVPPPEATLGLYPLGRAAAPCPSDIVLRSEVARAIGGFEEQFTGSYQLYEDQAFLAKLYLTSAIYCSSRTWLKYRLHPDSCVARVNKAGKYDEVRKYFLFWLVAYLRPRTDVDRRVQAALRRALRRHRHPGIHRVLAMAGRIRRYIRNSPEPPAWWR
jgi:glycosyltransferase involved in cell wall biosynthesis